MFITIADVYRITGFDIDNEDSVVGAQSLIETYVGRTEADVTDPRDIALLTTAVAYQAAYMENQFKMIYEQVPVKSIAVGGTVYSFPDGATDLLWLSPIAKKACSGLSWKRTRTLRTGKNRLPTPSLRDWWTED